MYTAALNILHPLLLEEHHSLLFKAQVANVSLINPDYAVIFLEETLMLSFSSRFQPLHQQALSPANEHIKRLVPNEYSLNI